ncbi:MAG: glycosyltransferase family 2 protein [Aerococcus sp.]|nr:glycosyltransferase family 2 protein [Aerococcus sp.]
MLISVIVPVYNTERTLKRTVDSLVNQTYKNLEIILVDDGSTDTSGELCDTFKEQDERIRVIHQANGGLSAARNTGIEEAHGDFLAFLDSDDAYAPYILEEFVTCYEKQPIDLFVFNIERVFPNRSEVKEGITKVTTDRESMVKSLFTYSGVDFFAHNKIYHKDLFKTVRFPVGKLYEDMNPVYDAVNQAECVAFTNQVGLLYYENNESITKQSFNPKQWDNVSERLILNDKVLRDWPTLQPESTERILDGLLSTGYKLASAKDSFADFQEYDQKLKDVYHTYQQAIAETPTIPWQKRVAWRLYMLSPRLYANLYRRYLDKS